MYFALLAKTGNPDYASCPVESYAKKAVTKYSLKLPQGILPFGCFAFPKAEKAQEAVSNILKYTLCGSCRIGEAIPTNIKLPNGEYLPARHCNKILNPPFPPLKPVLFKNTNN